MKKIITIIMCILLTGCTSQLTCENTTESETLEINEKTTISYTNNKIKLINTNIRYDIKDEILQQNFISIFNDIKSNYDKETIKYKYDISNETYILDINYSPSELKKETLNDLNVSTDLKKYTQSLIQQGFKCQ